MVSSSPTRHRRCVHGLLVGILGLLTACETVPPVRVDSNFASTEVFANRSPADVAVLPIEDGTPDGSVQRHLVFLRQAIEREMVDRLYSPLTSTVVDAAMRGAADVGPKESLLAPATLQKMVGRAHEDAVFAVRVQRWDESSLLVDKRIRFEFQAAMMGKGGELLWSGTIQGDVKAGGVGAAPRDRDAMAQNCGAMAVKEMMQRLPRRVL